MRYTLDGAPRVGYLSDDEIRHFAKKYEISERQLAKEVLKPDEYKDWLKRNKEEYR